jgi:hypothetical protein
MSVRQLALRFATTTSPYIMQFSIIPLGCDAYAHFRTKPAS